MASLVQSLAVPSRYKDARYAGSQQDYEQKLDQTTTLYVGNLSFFTTEEQIYALFSKCGEIKRIIMGLDRLRKTPCGFCFVEYYSRDDMLDALKFLNGTKLDERVVRTDLDPGYEEGRQFGRGKSGGQVRDEFRQEFDAGRGGWGWEQRRAREEATKERFGHTYQDVLQGPVPGQEAKSGGDMKKKRDRDDEEDEEMGRGAGKDDTMNEQVQAPTSKSKRLREQDRDDDDDEL